LLLLGPGSQATAGPYFARGTYYAGSGLPWDCDAGNELFDDGLHGDGAAGDGIFGCYVVADQPAGYHEWKIATIDWSEAYPSHPSHPLANAVLYLPDEAQEIHFRLDTNVQDEGWQPEANAVACSHFTILGPGYEFELIGSAPELGEWLSGIPVVMAEDLWIAYATIEQPGAYEFKFRVAGSWDYCNLGIHYNMFIGDNFTFTVTEPADLVRFEFNPRDGRGRAVCLGQVPTDKITWGQIKALYR
jgi:hypothetical protein